MKPFISICIPAYKNTAYLAVLLRSIACQTFTDYEVVITDDSPDDTVSVLCKEYETKFHLVHHKNLIVKGSPANWNVSIRMAKGTWIKTMHDDDWFADEHSLEKFAKAAYDNPDAGFIFSGYSNYENGKVKNVSIPGTYVERALKKSTLNLFKKNYIGHPSTTLIKNDKEDWYDEQTKWVVDFEFYIRCLNATPFYIIQEPLINIGINESQITKTVFGDIATVLPENLYLLQKMGTGILKNINVYDHFWRLFRNFNIRTIAEVENYAGNFEIPAEIKKMLQMQIKIPLAVLHTGVFSKLLMTVSFYKN